ncbi:MAG TPA: hypothetical protein VHT29_04705 [Solirubrobacteraceae bacterium]|jgi:prefoldin subunit 5|nr:hypothetical protein [Solirubrobacteraceae bacterium]
MPTVNTTSPKASKARTKATRKPAAAKATSAKSPSARRANAANATQAKASHAKGARTRAVHQAESALRQTETATRETAGAFGDYAERAVLIPVGAALIAREKVVSGVSDTISTYSTSSKAQAQLKRFERRGATARNRLEREVRKARVRVERELRQRRKTVESAVNDIDERRESIAKNGAELAGRVPELANKVQERILSLV